MGSPKLCLDMSHGRRDVLARNVPNREFESKSFPSYPHLLWEYSIRANVMADVVQCPAFG